MPTLTTTTDIHILEATCERCGQIARLTQAGWRHGWPPAGHDGHCPGTGLYPLIPDHDNVQAFIQAAQAALSALDLLIQASETAFGTADHMSSTEQVAITFRSALSARVQRAQKALESGEV